MTTVVREASIQLSRQRVDPVGLDQYIMKGLVEAFMKNPEVEPEFVQAFSALKEAVRKLFYHTYVKLLTDCWVGSSSTPTACSTALSNPSECGSQRQAEAARR